MASINSYRTVKGERRYDVRYRDGDGKQRSRAFSPSRTRTRSSSGPSVNGSPPGAGSPPTRSKDAGCSTRAMSVNGSAPTT